MRRFLFVVLSTVLVLGAGIVLTALTDDHPFAVAASDPGPVLIETEVSAPLTIPPSRPAPGAGRSDHTAETGEAKSASCGWCTLDRIWGGVSTFAYRFDSGVPSHVQQAAFDADADGWDGYHYYDPTDPNAITIRIGNDPDPDIMGWYNAGNNSVYLDQDWVGLCTSACNLLVGTINHEFGHTLGFGDFETGCDTSIMSYEANIWSITSPSADDICSLWNDPPGGPYPWCPDPQVPCEAYRKRGGGHPEESVQPQRERF